MSRVAVKEGILRWALQRSNQTADDLQRKFPKIQEWLDGTLQPTLRQLEAFAKTTLTPLGFFFLEKPLQDQLPIPHFRTLGDNDLRTPSANLLETMQIMQRRQAWMREFLIEQGQDKLSFVGSIQLAGSPVSIAQRARETLGFDLGWAAQHSKWEDALRALREAMEAAGVLVVVSGIVGNNTHRKLESREFRGFVLVDEYAPLVFINRTDGLAAQMFTLAHELAHVFLGSSAAFDLREMQPAADPIEQACNKIAAEFLVPARELHRIWQSIQNEQEPFQTIARQFKVSEIVGARRALDLALIDREAFLEFYANYMQDERRKATKRPTGGDFYRTQNLRVGKRFASTVIRAAIEGRLLYSEAYRLTDLYGKTFHRYMSELGIGGTK